VKVKVKVQQPSLRRRLRGCDGGINIAHLEILPGTAVRARSRGSIGWYAGVVLGQSSPGAAGMGAGMGMGRRGGGAGFMHGCCHDVQFNDGDRDRAVPAQHIKIADIEIEREKHDSMNNGIGNRHHDLLPQHGGLGLGLGGSGNGSGGSGGGGGGGGGGGNGAGGGGLGGGGKGNGAGGKGGKHDSSSKRRGKPPSSRGKRTRSSAERKDPTAMTSAPSPGSWNSKSATWV
jgi:hypothetical protein